MKAISIRHPSVDVILAGLESTVPRAARTHHRGPVLLHASSSFGLQERGQLDELRRAGVDVEPPAREARGALVGRARLVDCRPLAEDEWDGPLAGLRGGRRWAYELADVRALPPVPCAGHLFMFEVPKDVLSAAAAAARRAGRAPRPRPGRARGAR
ncbi:MAG TPA: hypothetical protein VK131_10310 [Candidatus Acidoferrales bacterium]|nr:hypothetical protein [Candidatus Acidoferrales bacterium]